MNFITKTFLLFVLSLLTSGLFAQKAGKAYSLSGKIGGLKDGTKVIFNYRKEDNAILADTAEIKKSTFKLKGSLNGATMGFLSFSGRSETMQLFMDNIKVTVVGHIDSIHKSVVKGSPEHDVYVKFFKMADNFRKKRNDLIMAYSSYQAQNLQKEMADVQDEDRLLIVRYRDSVKSFIKKHPKSLVSVYAILTNFDKNAKLNEVQELYKSLDASLQTGRYGKKIAENIERLQHSDVGQTAMDFTQPDLAGKKVSLSDYKGKYVLVDFWASWCGPCRKESPEIVAAFKKHKDKGFEVLSISLDQEKDPWLKAIQDDNLSMGAGWTHVSDLKFWNNEVAQKYGITFIPANYLIDPQGVIIAKDLRGETLGVKLDEVFKDK
ncbi:MAG: redoxin domain-containing protein [Bacteroidia bacterium]